MTSQSFTTAFTVDQTPEEAFAAIANVRGWWSAEIEGGTSELDDEFTYRYADVHYSKQRVTEVIASKKMVWLVLEATLNFTADQHEWEGTEIIFEVSKKGTMTEVRFTHRGLVPDDECFEKCSSAWRYYINGSLRNLIVAGKGQSNPKEEPKRATAMNSRRSAPSMSRGRHRA